MQTILQIPSDRNSVVHPRLRGNQCRCTGCGELFGVVSTFDRHRVGNYSNGRRCLTRSEMLARGWIQNDAQFWIRGHRPNIVPVLSRCAQERRSVEPLQLAAASP
jgi:hypothetical protein